MRGNLDDYVPVHVRIQQFRDTEPKGRIVTVMTCSDPVVFRAEVYREGDDQPYATGHASEDGGMGSNRKDSTVEKCETAAVGRALAIAGFEIKTGIASREEMVKAGSYQVQESEPTTDISVEYAKKAGAFLTGICQLDREEFENFKAACALGTTPWWSIAMQAKEEGAGDFTGLMEFLAGKNDKVTV